MPFENLLPSPGRPVLALDLETTGTDPRRDRIVEFALVQVYTDGAVAEFQARVNPGCPIPAEATAVHGITDDHVARCLPFRAYARVVADQLLGHDLVGFGVRRFDLPMLHAECLRAGVELDLTDVRVIDAMEIYHALEPRTLSAAVRSYCGRHHGDAHGALADATASLELLDGLVTRRPDLPRDLDGLHDRFRGPDLAGLFREGPSGPCFRRGKHAGRPLSAVAVEDPGYLGWLLDGALFPDARAMIAAALAACGG